MLKTSGSNGLPSREADRLSGPAPLAFALVRDVRRFLLLPTIIARPAVVTTPPVASRSAFTFPSHARPLRNAMHFQGWYDNVPPFTRKREGGTRRNRPSGRILLTQKLKAGGRKWDGSECIVLAAVRVVSDLL
jgi:hypothetical protein